MRAGVETHLCGVLIQIISNIGNPPENAENFPYSEDTLLSGRYLLGIHNNNNSGSWLSGGWTDSLKQMNWKCVQFQLHYDPSLAIYISVESCDECWALLAAAQVDAG